MDHDKVVSPLNTVDLELAAVATQLTKYRYRYNSEIQLQDGMQHVLEQAGYSVLREHTLGALRLRSDLWIDGLVVEVKVDGSLSAALRQVSSYMKVNTVKGVILASTERWATTQLQDLPEWGGKPFIMIRVQRQCL